MKCILKHIQQIYGISNPLSKRFIYYGLSRSTSRWRKTNRTVSCQNYAIFAACVSAGISHASSICSITATQILLKLLSQLEASCFTKQKENINIPNRTANTVDKSFKMFYSCINVYGLIHVMHLGVKLTKHPKFLILVIIAERIKF